VTLVVVFLGKPNVGKKKAANAITGVAITSRSSL